MVNRNLIRNLETDHEELDRELELAMAEGTGEQFEWGGGGAVAVNSVVDGRILRVDDEFVLVDVGYKSEGTIPLNEWDEGEEPPQVGQVDQGADRGRRRRHRPHRWKSRAA